MTFASDADSIMERFAREWRLLRPTVNVAYENSRFDTKTDAVDASGDPAPWVRLTVLPGESLPASLGSPKVYRSTGLVVVQVFTPVGTGPGLANELADDVAAVFRGKTENFVTFRASSRSRIGPDGPWFQINVSTPYLADLNA